MCGIVGYTGPGKPARSCSMGCGVSSTGATTPPASRSSPRTGDLFVEKRAGKVAVLTEALGGNPPRAGVGLGHTRWATHGRPSDLNAHPHSDCTGRITVVHNGIVENFRELRDQLVAAGHTLRSETDTEVVAHLVEDAYEGDLADAVRAALRRARRGLRAGRHAPRRARAARRAPG